MRPSVPTRGPSTRTAKGPGSPRASHLQAQKRGCKSSIELSVLYRPGLHKMLFSPNGSDKRKRDVSTSQVLRLVQLFRNIYRWNCSNQSYGKGPISTKSSKIKTFVSRRYRCRLNVS